MRAEGTGLEKMEYGGRGGPGGDARRSAANSFEMDKECALRPTRQEVEWEHSAPTRV